MKASWEAKLFEDEIDFTGMAAAEAVLDMQATAHRESGAVLRIARMGAASARYVQGGCGSTILLRGRGDKMGDHPWPEGAHIAIPSGLHPIAIVVDRELTDGRAVMTGDGKTQRLRLCL